MTIQLTTTILNILKNVVGRSNKREEGEKVNSNDD
jgi:hypothetical protein